jgi:hypothetical protein
VGGVELGWVVAIDDSRRDGASDEDGILEGGVHGGDCAARRGGRCVEGG